MDNKYFSNAPLRLLKKIRWTRVVNAEGIPGRHKLVKICEEHRDEIDREITKLVSNIVVKRNAEDLFARLKPVSLSIDLVQKDNCTIARCVVIWKNVSRDLHEILDNVAKKKLFQDTHKL